MTFDLFLGFKKKTIYISSIKLHNRVQNMYFYSFIIYNISIANVINNYFISTTIV